MPTAIFFLLFNLRGGGGGVGCASRDKGTFFGLASLLRNTWDSEGVIRSVEKREGKGGWGEEEGNGGMGGGRKKGKVGEGGRKGYEMEETGRRYEEKEGERENGKRNGRKGKVRGGGLEGRKSKEN